MIWSFFPPHNVDLTIFSDTWTKGKREQNKSARSVSLITTTSHYWQLEFRVWQLRIEDFRQSVNQTTVYSTVYDQSWYHETDSACPQSQIDCFKHTSMQNKKDFESVSSCAQQTAHAHQARVLDQRTRLTTSIVTTAQVSKDNDRVADIWMTDHDTQISTRWRDTASFRLPVSTFMQQFRLVSFRWALAHEHRSGLADLEDGFFPRLPEFLAEDATI